MGSVWDKFSDRERRLAIATAAVLVASLAFVFSFRAVSRVLDLNRTIDRLEARLTACYEREARGVSVEQAYKGVAAEHSSTWTEAEIHNRLRDEIYRLQLEDPELPPEKTKKLVEIPSLRQGALKDTGAGYREYQLTIKIPSTDIYSLLIFLCRLQQSRQALRIDALEIARPPESPAVMATITVTRTIVDSLPGQEGAEAPPVEQAPTRVSTWDGGRVEDWQGKDCDLSLTAEVGGFLSEGGSCLMAKAKTAGASFHMVHELETGTTYELLVDATAMVSARVQVARDPDGSAFEGVQELPGDGKTYRYRTRFTVDGEPGSKTKVRSPVITIQDQGGLVYVDNVTLTRQME